MTTEMLTFGLGKGDVLFWCLPLRNPPGDSSRSDDRSAIDFTEAVAASSIGDAFHVSLIESIDADRVNLIHATSSRGVIAESLTDYHRRLIEKESISELELIGAQIDCADSIKQDAVRYALSKIGCEYNDVFAENARNSRDQEAYYCCQLVRFAYRHAVGDDRLFPLQPLNFRDASGRLIDYWIEYFRSKGRPVPEDEFGSHPTNLMRSKSVTVVNKSILTKDRFVSC